MREGDHSSFWREYCNNYFKQIPATDLDLIRQVGYTVDKKPIPIEKIQELVQRIASLLDLRSGDVLLDFCCGNGLLDYELAVHVKQVIGIDFADSVIEAARRLKQRANTSYRIGSATDSLSALIGSEKMATKFLMASSLAYFQPHELDTILKNIRQFAADRRFRFLLVGIPNFDLQANFYDTPERVARHLENERTRPDTNDGLGRWWRTQEINALCIEHGLFVQIVNEPESLSNYRMDALICVNPDDLPAKGMMR